MPDELYVGIDQSYSGLAVVTLTGDSDEPGYALMKFNPDIYGTGGGRLNAIYNSLMDLRIPWSQATSIGMEGYAYGAKLNREKLAELGAVVKLLVYATPVQFPTVVAPTAVKRYATGKGNAVKGEVVAAVNERYGTAFTDDNLADAYVIAQITRDTSRWALDGIVPSDPRHKAIIEGLLLKGHYRDGAPRE